MAATLRRTFSGVAAVSASSLPGASRRHLSTGTALFNVHCDRNVYYDGDTVSGHVHGSVYRAIHVTAITMTLSCEFAYSDTSGTQHTDTLFSNGVIIWEGSELQPGSYDLPFDITVPPHLPPSAETLRCAPTGLPANHIRWRVTATCTHAEAGPNVALASSVFHKATRPDPAVPPPSTFAYARSRDRRLYVFGQLEKHTYVRGEPVGVHLVVHGPQGAAGEVVSLGAVAVQTEMLAGPGQEHVARQHVLDEAEVALGGPRQCMDGACERCVLLPAAGDECQGVVARGPVSSLGSEDTDHVLALGGRARVGLAASTMYRASGQDGATLLVSYSVHIRAATRDGTLLDAAIPFRLVDTAEAPPSDRVDPVGGTMQGGEETEAECNGTKEGGVEGDVDGQGEGEAQVEGETQVEGEQEGVAEGKTKDGLNGWGGPVAVVGAQ